jgi:hypothetical protein
VFIKFKYAKEYQAEIQIFQAEPKSFSYCQMTTFFSKKLTIMIITVNFEPLLQVIVKYMLQFDEFFAIKVYNEYQRNVTIAKRKSR